MIFSYFIEIKNLIVSFQLHFHVLLWLSDRYYTEIVIRKYPAYIRPHTTACQSHSNIHTRVDISTLSTLLAVAKCQIVIIVLSVGIK